MATTCASSDEMASEDSSNDNKAEDETVEVEFVPDESVTKISLRRTPARIKAQTATNNQNEKAAVVEVEDSEEDIEDVEEKPIHEVHNLLKARVLADEDNTGQSIFGFKTPKRKDALLNAAQNSIQKQKKSSKKEIQNSSSNTTVTQKQNASKRRPLYVEENTSSENDDIDNDDDCDEEDDYDNESTKTKELDGNDILDQYFEIHSNKTKPSTSDRTLATLQHPKLQQQELVNHLKEVQATHIPETVKLIGKHSCDFQRWMFQLLNGFNVVLYGLGSKHKLIEEFRKKLLKNQVHIVINGFFPSITIKQILNMICEDVLNERSTFRHVTDQANHIKTKYDREQSESERLFLVIHNIDGQMLRSKNAQSALACLASSRNIHVITSIDHINASLIWDQNLSSRFNWLWYDCTTYEPYAEETSYENSLMVQQTGTLALSSLIHVLRSLTPNAKGIFRLLVDCQLDDDNESNSTYQGLSFSDLYQKCRERFLVNSDLTLRAQLTEFKDHKLIKTKKAFNGLEYLLVALDNNTLRQFLELEDEKT